MLDATLRKWIDPPLNRVGKALAARGVTADQMTLFGFAAGMAGALAACFSLYGLALVGLLVGRVADGLDGAIARACAPTDRGGYLDITLDFLFYGAFPLAFAVANPAENALPAAVLLASFYATGTTFLGFAVMAAKRGKETAHQGKKSLYYLGGLTEGTETIALFIAFCLFPAGFAYLAYGFAILCLITAITRIVSSLAMLRAWDDEA